MNASYFSIIIPVYNIESYIAECVESILNQSFPYWEMILVNDGSTDSSGIIANRYKDRDKRIKVIHKENGGLSSSRNAGIRNASSLYIIFLDGDDYIKDTNYLLRAYKLLEKRHVDVVRLGFKLIIDGNSVPLQIKENTLSRMNTIRDNKQKIRWMSYNGLMSESACANILRTSFLKSNRLFFDERAKTEEDIDWTLRLFLSNPQIAGIDGAPYTYRLRHGSICRGFGKSGFSKNRYRAVVRSINILKNDTRSEEDKLPFYLFIANQYYLCLSEIMSEPDKKLRIVMIERLKRLDLDNKITSYKGNARINICRFVVKIFGTSNAARILNVYRIYRENLKSGKLKCQKK